MKKILTLLLFVMLLFLNGCSNDYEFADWPDDGLTLDYQNNTYACVSAEDCIYSYNSSDMVFLYSIEYGDFHDKGEAYNVYRHADDDKQSYLFAIPKPSIRDATPYAYVLKIVAPASSQAEPQEV